jgi:uncharacterized protein (TIGR00299 family) protein
MASPLNVGGGFVHCEHGRLPVPAPATAHLLRGVPIYSDGDSELVTPTGALVLAAYATAFGALPPMTIDRVGYGAGDRDPAHRPNVLRLLVGEMASGGRHERLGVLQCEIDDMNPQIFGSLMDRLFEAGALDVFYQPVQMKKNRPGTLVTVLAPPPLRDALTTILFAESTSIGVRYAEADRECLDRERIEVMTPWGPVRIKVARRAGAIMNAQPEFDDCLRAADRHNVSVKLVHAEAVRAWMERER